MGGGGGGTKPNLALTRKQRPRQRICENVIKNIPFPNFSNFPNHHILTFSKSLSRRPIRPAFISGFCSMKRLGVFLLPLGWDASPSQGYPQHSAGNHLYTWVERGTAKVKCLAQEHSTMSPARTRTWTTRSGVEHSNHEDTAPLCAVFKQRRAEPFFCLRSI